MTIADINVSSLRASIIAEVWSGNGLPTTGADSITVGATNPLSAGSTPNNLSRTDRYDYTCLNNTEEEIQDVYHWLWIPTNPNGKLVMYCFGHSADVNVASAGNLLIKALVEGGFTVSGHIMPADSVITDMVTYHNTFPDPTESLNMLRVFVEGPIRLINEVGSNYDAIYMAGHSGGGWTTVLTAAIDSRISRSYHTAGMVPLTSTENNRDWEQLLPGLSGFLDYPDLCILGCDASRRQKQNTNVNDTCCFDIDKIYEVGECPYIGAVSREAKRRGFNWSHRYDYLSGHEISAGLRADMVEFFS